MSKSGSETDSICQGYVHFDHFFSTSQKSCFQNPTVLRRLTTPHIRFAKSNYFPNSGQRTNERTDTRNTLLEPSHGRKERFAQLSIQSGETRAESISIHENNSIKHFRTKVFDRIVRSISKISILYLEISIQTLGF